MKIHGSKLEVNYDIPYEPTHEQMESALYVYDYIDEDNDNEVETFADIKSFFDGWNQYADFCWRNNYNENDPRARSEYEQDHWETVYDYITDCLHWYGGAFLPVRIIEGKE